MFEDLTRDPRVRVRTAGPPDPEGRCVVYWMQRAHRAVDNPALDTAIAAGNELGQPVVVFLGLVPFVERANLRHFQFLAEGVADIADGLARRRVGFVLRRYPDHRLEPFLEEVRAALVVGDESPLRQFEGWRRRVAAGVRLPFWTVDADVVVPSALLLKEQYAARTMRPRIHAHLDRFLADPARDVGARGLAAAAVGGIVVPGHRPAGRVADRPFRRSCHHLSRRHARSPPASGRLHPADAGRLRSDAQRPVGTRDERTLALPSLRAYRPTRSGARGQGRRRPGR